MKHFESNFSQLYISDKPEGIGNSSSGGGSTSSAGGSGCCCCCALCCCCCFTINE